VRAIHRAFFDRGYALRYSPLQRRSLDATSTFIRSTSGRGNGANAFGGLRLEPGPIAHPCTP
jgi:hypothetical protein